MSKTINCEFVGMKKNKGKSNGFKSLQQEVKRKQKAEEIVKAIQKIQNEPKQKKEPQFKTKHFKTYANSDRNIKEDLECYEQATIDAVDERDLERMEEVFEAIKNNDYADYHEQWSNIQINLNRDVEEDEEQQRDHEYNFEHSNAKDWSDDYYPEFPVQDIEDKYSDLDDYERRNETNEAIYEYVCGNSSEDSCTEELEPIVPKHLEFESRIYDLETQLRAAQETIFQLLGGLFNHETQTQILDNHMKFLYTGRTLTDEEIEESRFPTTRQGDANEARIQKLEENIDELVKRLKKGRPLHRFYRKFQKK